MHPFRISLTPIPSMGPPDLLNFVLLSMAICIACVKEILRKLPNEHGEVPILLKYYAFYRYEVNPLISCLGQGLRPPLTLHPDNIGEHGEQRDNFDWQGWPRLPSDRHSSQP